MSDLQEPYDSYDVPPHCNFDDDDDNVDSWFDQIANTENMPPESSLTTENMDSETVMQADNAVKGSSKKQQSPKAKSRRSSKRLSAQERSRHMAKIRAERKNVPPKQEQPPRKRTKLSSSKSKSTDKTINKGLSTSTDGSPKLKQKTVTLPTTPTVLKRKPMTHKLKNSEEQELEKVQQLQQEMADRLKKNEESLKSVLAGDQPLKKVSIQATKPVDFHFYTDDRVKRHPEEQPTDYKKVDFTSELRRHPPSPYKLGPTVPKPFNLSKSNKRKFEETTAEYTSTAAQVLAFQSRTPERFHLRSRQKEMEGPAPVKALKTRMTIARTPKLQTKQRNRAATCKSSAEIEAEELEKLQQYKFKAQELNLKILEGGPILPKKPPIKEPTKAVGFNLEIEKRIQQREKKDEDEEIFVFHSKPCPSKILKDVVGVPGKKMLPPTVPQSPAFALKNRVRMLASEESKKEEPVPIKANPMPYFGVPFKPKLVEQKTVEVCPFSFSNRDRQMMEEKEKKLEELRNAEAPKFKAQPLPDFDHISLPERKVKEITQMEPFHLEIDKRGETRLQMWKQQVQEDLKLQKEMCVFKARPNTVTHQEPFVPKKESRALSESLSGSIVQEGFELATERRARERQEFERRLAEMEAQKCAIEEEERRQQEEEEKEEINQLRHEIVHKAQPVRKFKSVDVKSSDVPLTVPKSPNFSDRFNI